MRAATAVCPAFFCIHNLITNTLDMIQMNRQGTAAIMAFPIDKLSGALAPFTLWAWMALSRRFGEGAHPMGHSSDVHGGWGAAGPSKPVQLSHMDVSNHGTCAVTAACQGSAAAGNWVLNPHTTQIWDRNVVFGVRTDTTLCFYVFILIYIRKTHRDLFSRWYCWGKNISHVAALKMS